jgi:hypothetical protein
MGMLMARSTNFVLSITTTIFDSTVFAIASRYTVGNLGDITQNYQIVYYVVSTPFQATIFFLVLN